MKSKNRNIFGFLLIIMIVVFFWVIAYGNDSGVSNVGTNVVTQLQKSPAGMKWFPVKDILDSGEIWTYGFSEEYLFGWIQNCPKHNTWHIVLYMGGLNTVHLYNAATKKEAKWFLEKYAWEMYHEAVEHYDDRKEP